MDNDEHCPLCLAESTRLFFSGEKPDRDYLICDQCELVFVPRRFHVSPKQEKKIYDLHENDPNDQHYRNFLGKLMHPMLPLLPNSSKGLDFGAGPGPTLSLMFQEKGHQCEIFDKFYANEPARLLYDYDFISCTEVVEHLDQPHEIFTQLFQMLSKRNGVLGVMTKLRPEDKDAFKGWHYKNDPTHICFYNRKTMQSITSWAGYTLNIFGSDVIIFEKR